MDDIHGKTALVTGSSQGLGKVIAKQIAAAGAHVLINCFHSPEKAEAVCKEIIDAGGSAECFAGDITDEKFVTENLRPRRIDILVNNARLDPYKRPENTGDGAWFNMLMNVNVTGAYLCSLAVIEGMKARRWGRILNVSSVQAYLGMNLQLLPYAATKAAMLAMTRCFAKQLGDYGITVNSLAPGMVITENIHKRLSQEVIDAKLQSFPLHRAATSEEVAECAVNTICCGAMTGEIVNINSGVYFPA